MTDYANEVWIDPHARYANARSIDPNVNKPCVFDYFFPLLLTFDGVSMQIRSMKKVMVRNGCVVVVSTGAGVNIIGVIVMIMVRGLGLISMQRIVIITARWREIVIVIDNVVDEN